MKKIVLLLFCFVALNSIVYAQNAKYTTHTIAEGETLSVIAAKYHSTVGDIMRLNGMNSKSVLKTGVKIKIPLTGNTVKPAAVEKTPSTAAANTGAATHIVQPHETLYGISKKYGVTIDQLKQWNNLENVNLEIGQELAVSSNGVAIAAANKKAAQQKADEIKQAATNTADKPAEKTISVDSLAQSDAAQKKQETNIAVVPENTNKAVSPNAVAAGIVKDGSDSYFANDFMAAAGTKLKKASGDCMTFKTASGWLDKKYYILMNDAPVGSIVKVTTENGNSIYAKVLWKLEDMKLNNGLSFRISEAAAAALNIAMNKFNLTVDYHE